MRIIYVPSHAVLEYSIELLAFIYDLLGRTIVSIVLLVSRGAAVALIDEAVNQQHSILEC